jgi:hypothetical protein
MSAIDRLRNAIQLVRDIVIDSDGNAKCTGIDDEDQYEPTVGYIFGFQSRPTTSRGVMLKSDGQGNTSFLVAFRNKQYELSLQKGEVGIKNEFDASTLWDKDGNITSVPGSGKVKLGAASGLEPAVLGDSLQTRLADLESKLLSHTHVLTGSATCAAGGGAITGSATPTSVTLPHQTDNIKASKVEVK